MASRRAVRGLARMCASTSTSALTNTTGMRTEVMHTRTVCSLPHGFSRDIDVWQGRSRPQSSSASLTHRRALSNKPYDSVYGGPKPPNNRVTLRRLMQKYRAGERISVVTAYDYPSAVAVDQSGIDVLLVGDSAAMVVHGHDTTLPITLEEMLTHCRAVARGAQRPLLVGDLPFGSYEQSPGQAVASATRMLKEGSMDAVKLEGGSAGRITTVQTLVDAGIAVMGHVGLTPQSISVLGGFRPQGRTLDEAASVVDKALALQNAGCFAIVLECVPRSVAAAVTEALDIPTIGIGAGDQTSGQVLVYHDLLGFTAHPHHKKVTPKFSKQYADVGTVIAKALEQFKNEVHAGTFPSQLHSPYRLGTEDSFLLADRLREKGLGKAADAVLAALEEEKGE